MHFFLNTALTFAVMLLPGISQAAPSEAEIKSKIVGSWSAKAQLGDEYRLVIRPDGTVNLKAVMPNGKEWGNKNGTWTVKGNKLVFTFVYEKNKSLTTDEEYDVTSIADNEMNITLQYLIDKPLPYTYKKTGPATKP